MKQSLLELKHKLTWHFVQVTREMPWQLDRLHLSLLEVHFGQCPTLSNRMSDMTRDAGQLRDAERCLFNTGSSAADGRPRFFADMSFP